MNDGPAETDTLQKVPGHAGRLSSRIPRGTPESTKGDPMTHALGIPITESILDIESRLHAAQLDYADARNLEKVALDRLKAAGDSYDLRVEDARRAFERFETLHAQWRASRESGK